LGHKESELYDTCSVVKEEVVASDGLVVDEKEYVDDYGFLLLTLMMVLTLLQLRMLTARK